MLKVVKFRLAQFPFLAQAFEFLQVCQFGLDGGCDAVIRRWVEAG